MYQTLYRKYRPCSFGEIYGQHNAKTILKNAIIKKQLSHAYLFFGPRGTGKTSIAKMFARICNCLNPNDGECCEKCENCLDSKQKNCVDIIEIDAASNNGVDEIRELKNRVNLVPNKLKYKVYIIDEVHMLSIGAFNALLKTLEEPPEHVIFILATTDYYKVPATIISRCQCIEFKNIDNESMFKRLDEISKLENIKISSSAIEEIVNDSNGGMRDAIGLLDKINSYSEENSIIEADDVRTLFGNLSKNEIYELADIILLSEYTEVMNRFMNYVSDGKDIQKILYDVISYISELIVNSFDTRNMEKLKVLYKYYNEMKKTYNKQLTVKMMIAELASTNVQKNISREIISEKNEFKMVNNNEKKDCNNLDFSLSARINNSFVNANKESLVDLKNKWKKLDGDVFDSSEGSYVCDLLDTIPVVVSDKNILLSSQYDSVVDKINCNSEIYRKIINDKLSLDRKIAVISDDNWKILKKEYSLKIKSGEEIKFEDETVLVDSNNKNMSYKENSDTIEEKAQKLFGEMLI